MFDKIKDTANTTIEKSKEATDDSIKYGIRFDGEGSGNTGYIHHNIVWNCEGGIMVKGGDLYKKIIKE